MGLVYTIDNTSAVSGNGGTKLRHVPTKGKRLHGVQYNLGYAGGVNTLAALLGIITEIRWGYGTIVKAKLSSTELRDFLLLRGTTYDFNGVPNTGCQFSIPFAPEWFRDEVADALAWDPTRLGGDVFIEMDCSSGVTINKAIERVSDDVGAVSAGIMSLEVIKPAAGSTKFAVTTDIEEVGSLISASIYPDSGGSNEPTPVTLEMGSNRRMVHERLTSAENDEQLERFSLTPAATGRTANIYDIVSVKESALGYAWPIIKPRLTIEAGGAMSGTSSILLCRQEIIG